MTKIRMLSNSAGFGTGQEVEVDDALAKRLIERGKASAAGRLPAPSKPAESKPKGRIGRP